jgi:Fic family protein
MIPVDAVKPTDGRYNSAESLLDIIDQKKAELDTRRPLTEGEVARLTEEFVVEYTYNSNAIEGNTLTLRETDMVLRGLTIDKKPLKDHMEAVGHKEAFEYISGLVKDCMPMSESILSRYTTWFSGQKRGSRRIPPCTRPYHGRSARACTALSHCADDGAVIDQIF